MTQKQKKKITIFTYDNDSRMDIIEHLRQMNSGKIEALFSLNDLAIICTDGSSDGLISEFLDFLDGHKKEDYSGFVTLDRISKNVW